LFRPHHSYGCAKIWLLDLNCPSSDEQWIDDVMQDFTVPLLDEFVQLWGPVEDAGFQPEDLELDTILWTRTSSGDYSAKSAYKMQFEGGIFSSFPKTVWKVWAPSCCKFFLWLLLQNRVWTADRLSLREWPNSYFCQQCHRNLETGNHLFIQCPIVHLIWQPISTWCRRQSLNPVNWDLDSPLMVWFEDLAGSAADSATRGIRSLAILVTWRIWCERNNRIFNDHETSITRRIQEIKDEARLWCVEGAKHLSSFCVLLSSFRG
jgi:hypothetical protein